MNNIDLISYNVFYGNRFDNNREDSIKIYYNVYFKDELTVRIQLGDDIFNTVTQYQKLKLHQGSYWSHFPSQNMSPFVIPQRLQFINDENNSIIKEFKLDIKFVDISLRNHKVEKNAWIIGDSHIKNLRQDIKDEDLVYEKIKMTPIPVTSLSISRFYKSNYLKYLSHFPIYDDDILIFNLGEIDIRMSIHVKSNDKNIDKKVILQDIIFNYFRSIKKISETYPNNKIVLLRPNPQISDNHIKNEEFRNTYFLHSDESDRLNLNVYLDTYLKSFTTIEKKIFYVDNSSQYEINGFINNDFLLNNDIHMKTNKQYFDSLYDKIKDL